jgi:hypothetical protein
LHLLRVAASPLLSPSHFHSASLHNVVTQNRLTDRAVRSTQLTRKKDGATIPVALGTTPHKQEYCPLLEPRGRMIDRTVLQIERLNEHHEREREHRYARRNRIRYIDELLNEFELLNLADEPDVPRELTGKAYQLVAEEEHPILRRPLREVPIADWMDALYDLQDTLMLTVEDDID